MNPIPLASVSSIKDQQSLFSFLNKYLDWPIQEDIHFEDATFFWDTDEFDYPKEYFKGSEIFQLRPFNEVQPWGIFFLHLSKPKPGLTELRNIVRSLSPAKRKLKDYPTWEPNHLLFICTHNWKDYTFAHFDGDNPGKAKLSTFEWQYNSSYLRTVCEFNLSALRMPEAADFFQQPDQKKWIAVWSKAFDIKKVTDQFFKDMVEVFTVIQKEYVTNLKGETKRSFTQLLINRLLFLKFLEKKGWLFVEETDSIEQRKNYLNRQRTLHKNQNEWDYYFYNLFFRGLNRLSVPGSREIPAAMKRIIGNVPFLNGGLFEDDPEYKAAKVDNEAFDLIFDKLLNPYNFTIEENTPLDIEVALNPDLLGYAYEELIAKRHGQGAYYTHPTEVGLMCRESLKTFLEEHTNINIAPIAHLVDLREAAELTDDEAFLVYKKLINIKIVDPAIGSGAYPVRMMQELVGIHQALAEKLSQGKLNLIIQSKLADPNSRYQLKLSIMQNNLYGADIDYFAVEIAKLRFWLSLVVDYDVEVNEAKDLDNIPALPNLDFKLRVGDSLLSIIGKGKDKGEKINLDLILKNKNPDVFFVEEARKLRGMKEKYFSFEQLRKEKLIPETRTKDDFKNDIIKQEDTLANAIGIKQYEKIDKSYHILWEIHFAEVFDEKEGFGFDICIANPPYVMDEKINELFSKFESGITKNDLINVYEELYSDMNLIINKKSDLYVYFYLRGLLLLKNKGVLCFICSNSWLDVGFGSRLQEILLRKSRIKSIFDNNTVRSFEKADVNTTINIFIKDLGIKLNEDPATGKKFLLSPHISRFVTFGDNFELTAISAEMLKISQSNKFISNKNWRIFPIAQDKIYESGLDENYKYVGDKWVGKYLRSPSILLELLTNKISEKLIDYGDIALGLTSCQNDYFYLDEEMISKFKIPNQYLWPIFKSPTESNKILVEENTFKNKVFIYNETKINQSVLKYIKYGENINVPNVECLQGREPWYSLGNPLKSNIFIPYSYNDAFRTFYSKRTFICDKRLIHFNPFDKNLELNLACLLNSTMWFLLVESNGSTNLGQGALIFNTKDFRKIPFFYCSITEQKSKYLFSSLFKRKIESILTECGFNKTALIRSQIPNPLPDRKALDDIVFDALGLTKAEREEVYFAVCELVLNRLNKARSV